MAFTTGGAPLLNLGWFLMYTGPGFIQDGIDFPEVDFREKLNNFSWGVVFVAVHKRSDGMQNIR